MARSRSRKLRSRKRLRKLQRSTRKQRGAGFFNTIKNRVGRIFGSKVDQEPVPLTATPLAPLPPSRQSSLANAGNGVNNNNNYVPPMPPMNKNNSGNNNWVMVGKNTY